jgi:hypothetical protein
MKQLIIILTILPTILWGQTATFHADTTDLWQGAGQRRDVHERIMEMEWRIRGQVLRFGSKPIVVKTDPNKIDTLFYKQNSNAKWDTIVCNVNEPLTYKFVYNECCGGFNVAGPDSKFIVGKVNFRIIGKQANKRFLGTLGETGVLADVNTTSTLSPGCRSAMSPNIYLVSFKEIRICSDSLICKEDICLFEIGKNELNYEFKFETISSKINFLFLPLSSVPIQVTYDTKSDTVTIDYRARQLKQ